MNMPIYGDTRLLIYRVEITDMWVGSFHEVTFATRELAERFKAQFPKESIDVIEEEVLFDLPLPPKEN